jgi:Asp-tRNA(Asn)/Glu-tRNA(Gln) amidotransferase A subunit family amidase
MPIGLQLVSKAWAEAKLLMVGELYEKTRGFEIPVASLAKFL